MPYAFQVQISVEQSVPNCKNIFQKNILESAKSFHAMLLRQIGFVQEKINLN